jgi:putative ABC transport system permease protein
LVTARLSLPAEQYATSEARWRFVERLNARLSSSPVLSGTTLATAVPFDRIASARQLAVDMRSTLPDDELPTVAYVQVAAQYFDVMGLRMIRGRALSPGDADAGREGVVIDQRLAQMFFSGRDPVGQQIRLIEGKGRPTPSDARTIVGIAPTIPQNLGAREDARPVVFAPISDLATPSTFSFIVRSRSDAPAALSQLREEVRALDPNLPVYYAQTLDEVFADARWALSLIGVWFGALAVIAVVLAAVGLFAMTGHAVTQRTQEIGVRIALGARSGEIMWLFMRRTLVQLALGTATGLAGALAAGQLVQNWIGRTDPRDPLTLVLVMLVLALVALIATLLPARRATRIDPIMALRTE